LHNEEFTMSDVQSETAMKLSEAIREGSKMTTQSPWRVKHVGSACALGAAADAVGCTIEDGGDDRLVEFFPQLMHEVPPYEEFPKGNLRLLVCSLNNGGRSRERIADIVEQLGY
jgi:hypothetical protein